MFCGKPVIATDLPWCDEYFTDGENILTARVNDYKQLADNIMQLINNSDLLQRLNSNAIKIVDELFSYEKNMIKMESVMNNAIDKHKGASSNT